MAGTQDQESMQEVIGRANEVLARVLGVLDVISEGLDPRPNECVVSDPHPGCGLVGDAHLCLQRAETANKRVEEICRLLFTPPNGPPTSSSLTSSSVASTFSLR